MNLARRPRIHQSMRTKRKAARARFFGPIGYFGWPENRVYVYRQPRRVYRYPNGSEIRF